jgi:hypothetical protein
MYVQANYQLLVDWKSEASVSQSAQTMAVSRALPATADKDADHIMLVS